MGRVPWAQKQQGTAATLHAFSLPPSLTTAALIKPRSLNAHHLIGPELLLVQTSASNFRVGNFPCYGTGGNKGKGGEGEPLGSWPTLAFSALWSSNSKRKMRAPLASLEGERTGRRPHPMWKHGTAPLPRQDTAFIVTEWLYLVPAPAGPHPPLQY